jgi:hypothetical protein
MPTANGVKNDGSGRDSEWGALYSALSETLDVFGNGRVLDHNADFFIVDDDWGGYHHKLCVISPEFWSDADCGSISRSSALTFRAGALSVFELEARSKRWSLVIYRDGIAPYRRYE